MFSLLFFHLTSAVKFPVVLDMLGSCLHLGISESKRIDSAPVFAFNILFQSVVLLYHPFNALLPLLPATLGTITDDAIIKIVFYGNAKIPSGIWIFGVVELLIKGKIPLHTYCYDFTIYILAGNAKVRLGVRSVELEPYSAAYFPAKKTIQGIEIRIDF